MKDYKLCRFYLKMFRATHVPVGEDQVQHIQLAQHLVNTFNARFGETFPPVKAVIEGMLLTVFICNFV
jgi:tryptophanyl-tRNA synthetase